MTPAEYKAIEGILFDKDKSFLIKSRMVEFMKTVKVVEGTKPTRTSSQNNALHLFFKQISDTCQNQGVTMNLIIKHTHDVAVTPYGVKALWHVLQKALYGTESTTELKKTGQIDTMYDHFVALFAKEEVEIPPFPSDETKTLENLAPMKNTSTQDYPEYTGAPTI